MLINTFNTFADILSGGSSGSPGFIQQQISKTDAGAQNVGSEGSVSYNYPVGGDLILSYNSNGGWRLIDYSLIERSTKPGVPRYYIMEMF